MRLPRTALIRPAMALAAAALLAACAAPVGSSSPGASDPGPTTPAAGGKLRAPDAQGTVVSVEPGIDSVLVGFEPDPGFEYFEGTVFDLGVYYAVGGEGVDFEPWDLQEGDRIWVWVGDCAESFPVQCGVERAQRIED